MIIQVEDYHVTRGTDHNWYCEEEPKERWINTDKIIEAWSLEAETAEKGDKIQLMVLYLEGGETTKIKRSEFEEEIEKHNDACRN